MDFLEVKELRKSYGNQHVLKGVNTFFEPHEIHGIIGRNGAGKSTFFECICGLKKYEGEILSSFDPIKDHIAYLPTVPFFFPKITGREYLNFLLRTSDNKNSDMHELIDVFDLPLTKYVEHYSTGMKKKISFLGLLLLERPIYILDEPFNGIDMEGVELFKSIIEKKKEQGCTILISSHIIESLTDICSDIYYLKDGVLAKKYQRQNFANIKKETSAFLSDKISSVFKTEQ
ncbi:MAG: ATP-binding cassette domain-containing protein [Flavobacteriaceae bacterium]|uniref:ATP-binding cassette domain-containing protein n=1 Tax=Nonlabens ulvanivorans TaxID=906888 RepID=UPI00326E8AF7